MPTATLVPDPAVVTLEEIGIDDRGITLLARTRQAVACCPVCDQPATRIHSWYTRRLDDLPWQGLAVRLHFRTRRWFCDNPHCDRRIFTERLPTIAAPHSRRTQRLATIVLVFGVAVGGAPGAHLLAALGIGVSDDTLRRAVGRAALPEAATPRVLGVDDWSLRKGCMYGTILVDLEERRPVDLLPDRSAAGLEAWLMAHPGVEIICRDRSGAYADGARQGAPDAIQVADRWHLFANLGDLLERLLVRHHAALGQVRLAEPVTPAPEAVPAAPPGPPPVPTPPAPRPPTRTQQERQRRIDRREARHREIHALQAQGHSIRAIAQQLHLSRTTVGKYLAAPTCPHPGPRPQRQRRITPFVPYLRQRWTAGERRPRVLWDEIRAQGFPGSWRRVQEQTAVWRRAERQAHLGSAEGTPITARPAQPAGKRCAPRQVATWLVRAPADLRPAQRAYLEALIAACPAIGVAQDLAQDFVRLLRTREVAGLAPWLVRAEECTVTEVREFAAGIRRDQPAVQAALAYAWNSGQVEGQVNRLKLVKRSMYGRASFALLRQRFLLAA
jgi:transposase